MRSTFGPADERLVAPQDGYDPTNLFSLDQNVTPSEPSGPSVEEPVSDRAAGFAADSREGSTGSGRPTTASVILPSALLVASVLGAFGPAAATVGYVLAEALLLYVGYGVLARVASPAVRDVLAST